MLEFHPIKITDRPEIEKYTAQSDYQSCEYAFTNLFIWRQHYHTAFAAEDGALFIRNVPNSLLLLPISLILIAIHLPNLFGLQDFVKWYFYFVVGALMHSYNSLETFISKNITCIICLIIAIGIFVFTPALKYREGSIIHAIATCLLICILFCLVKKRWNNKQGLKVNAAFIYVVGNSSMGIYIFHFWVLIFMLSSTSIRLFHLNKLVEHVSYPFGRKLDNCKFSDKFCSYSASKKDSLRLLAVGRKLYK